MLIYMILIWGTKIGEIVSIFLLRKMDYEFDK